MAERVIADLVTRWRTDGADQAAAALEKAAAATEKADAAITKYAADSQKAMAPATDALAKSQDTFSRKTLATEKSIESLQKRIDPTYRALRDWETAQRKVNLAIEQGTVTQERGQQILAGYEGRYRTIVSSSKKITDAVNDNTNAFRLNRVGLMELQAAGINAFQALAAGMSFDRVAMMEGGQVIGAFVQGTEGGLKNAVKSFGSGALRIGASIMSTFGTFPVVALGATAAIAGLYKGFSVLDDWINHTTADAQEFATWLDKIGQGANSTAGFIDKVGKAIQGMSLVDLNKTMRGSAEFIRQQRAQLDNPLATIAGTEGVMNDPKFVQTYQLIDTILAKLRGNGFKSLEDLHQSLDDIVKTRPDLQRYVEEWEKLGEAILKANQAAEQGANQAELKAHGMGAYQPRDGAALQKYFSGDALSNAQRQQAAALQSINARTVAERAAAAAAEVAARPIDYSQNPNVRIFEESAAKAKVFAQATRQANDALRDTQDALKTAGLQGYAQQVAQINAEIERQIALNPENADTWRKVGEAQKKALDIQTKIALFQGQTDSLATMNAEVAAIGKTDDYYRILMATIQAKIELERQGISVTSAAGQAYIENARKLSTFNAQIERQKGAWDDLKQGGGQAIDDLFSGLTDGTTKLNDVLKTVGTDLLKTFEQLALANPLKNSLLGTDLPTISDLFTKIAAPSLSTPSIVGLGATPASAMWVRNADILGGAGGQQGGIFGWLSSLFGGGAANDNTSMSAAARAIKSIESSGNYSALGPILASGDRAYGAYQVMGANIGPWTRRALGYAMSPDQFLASPGAQDSVFNTVFGGYAQQYGMSGAAQAWFGGPGSIGKNVSDALGTTMTQYVDKFTSALGGATKATDVAASGLGTLGGGFDRFGQTLANMPLGGGGGGGGLFGWIGSLFGFGGGGGISAGVMAQIAKAPGGLYAKGGTFPHGISAFSNSVVASPTLFRFANGTGLMGEAGPEGVLPLRRNSRGQLGVITANENGGPNVLTLAPVYKIDARGADQGAVTRLQRALDKHVKDHGKIVAAGDHRLQIRKTRPA